jgi:hypothetical protein
LPKKYLTKPVMCWTIRLYEFHEYMHFSDSILMELHAQAEGWP